MNDPIVCKVVLAVGRVFAVADELIDAFHNGHLRAIYTTMPHIMHLGVSVFGKQ